MRGMRLVAALLGLLGWAPRLAAEKSIEIDVLPGEGLATAEVVARLQELMGTEEGRARLEQSTLLSMLPEEVASVEVMGADTPAIDVGSASDMRAAAVTDVTVLAGQNMQASAGGALGLLGGSVDLQTSGTVSAVAGQVELSAAGELLAATAGAAMVTADSSHASVTGDLSAEAGHDIALTGGGQFELNAAGSGSVAFGEELQASAARVDLRAAEKIAAAASSIDVTAEDAMRMQTPGAVVELDGDGGAGVEYVSFALRSPSSFDSFETAVPLTAGITSVLISTSPGGGAAALGGAHLCLSLPALASRQASCCV